jgi:hypothetical protein
MTYENVIKSVHAPGCIVRTDDEVNLRTKFERKVLVAHELVHLDGLNNSEFCNTLSRQDLV